jgi:HPt (histidine-containing phosphotransfer) domain-containing protein
MGLYAIDAAPIYSPLGDDPDLAELVELFVHEVPDRVAAIAAAFQAREWRRAEVLSHQLQGAAGSYGFPELSRLARALEVAAQRCSGDAAVSMTLEDVALLCRRLRGPAG